MFNFKNIISAIKQRKTLKEQASFEYKDGVLEMLLDLEKRYSDELGERSIKVLQELPKNASKIPLRTQISDELTSDLVCDFFSFIDKDWGDKVRGILNGDNHDIKIESDESKDGDTRVEPASDSKTKMVVYLKKMNNLRKVYNAVHELTHVLSLEGDTSFTTTRSYLGEVDSISMENLLDDYLLGLSDEEMQKYGFKRDVLELDVATRRKASIFDRMRNCMGFIRYLRDGREDLHENRQYAVAQVYASRFHLFPMQDKTTKIKEILTCIKNDDFEGVNKVFGIDVRFGYAQVMEALVRETVDECKELQENGIDLRKYQEELDGESR